MTKVADRIRYERERLGLSQEELAKRCGYAGRSTISKIEKSENDINSKNLQKIANALGTTVGTLMGWEVTVNTTDKQRELLFLCDDVPDKDMDRIIAIVKAYLNK